MAPSAIKSLVVPPGKVSVTVPTPSWLELALHSEVADSVPALLKLSCDACGPATSCWPLAVKIEIWLSGLRTTVTFISCASWVMSWSRWSSSEAVALSLLAASSCWLICAICCRAVLAVCTSLDMPCSAWVRSCWIVDVIELRFCVSACAAPITALCCDDDDGLLASPCKAVVKLL